MAKTISRETCSACGKKNLCTWANDEGTKFSQCKTNGCNGAHYHNDQISNDNSFVNAVEAKFENFTEPYRGISIQTLEFLGIKSANVAGVELISYDHNNLDGSFDLKIRYPNKVFSWQNKTKSTSLFAIDKCQDFSKPLIITEGNEDAATLWDLGYQATSIHSAGNDTDISSGIKQDIEYIDKFPEIWLCLDSDKAGKLASDKIKEVLSHKLLREVDLAPKKDANEWYIDDPQELIKRLQNSREIVPEGIIFGNQLDRSLYRIAPPKGLNSFCPGLTAAMGGYERGCLYALLAGSTTGKSTFLRHEVYNLRTNYPDLRIANLFFEESQRITPQLFVAIDNNIPLGKLKREPSILNDDKFNLSWDKLVATDNLMFVDKKFKKDTKSLIKYVEYLVKVKKYDIIIIDHISYVIGRTESSKSGERKDIDKLIYDLQDLVVELGCIIMFACHITDDKNQDSWDTGKVPSLYSGRGSKVLAHAPDAVIALSRNNNDKYQQNVLHVHCKKSRWDGFIGETDIFDYITDTGRLLLRESKYE